MLFIMSQTTAAISPIALLLVWFRNFKRILRLHTFCTDYTTDKLLIKEGINVNSNICCPFYNPRYFSSMSSRFICHSSNSCLIVSSAKNRLTSGSSRRAKISICLSETSILGAFPLPLFPFRVDFAILCRDLRKIYSDFKVHAHRMGGLVFCISIPPYRW